MKNRIKFILGLVIWPMMSAHLYAEVNLTKLVNKIRPAVATVIVYDANRQVNSIGSGFFIDKTGHLITNYHVLEGSYAADVRTADGKTYPVKMVVAENQSRDTVFQ